MGTIKIGDTVKMKNGGDAKILAEFGSGGDRVQFIRFPTIARNML